MKNKKTYKEQYTEALNLLIEQISNEFEKLTGTREIKDIPKITERLLKNKSRIGMERMIEYLSELFANYLLNVVDDNTFELAIQDRKRIMEYLGVPILQRKPFKE